MTGTVRFTSTTGSTPCWRNRLACGSPTRKSSHETASKIRETGSDPETGSLQQTENHLFERPNAALRMSLRYHRAILPTNSRIKMEGLKFLKQLPDACAATAFFDPQFRGVYDKMKYGNEDTSRNAVRCETPADDGRYHHRVRARNYRVCSLLPVTFSSGWTSFTCAATSRNGADGTKLSVVDMLTWDKGRIGLGYRTRPQKRILHDPAKGAPTRERGLDASEHSRCVE